MSYLPGNAGDTTATPEIKLAQQVTDQAQTQYPLIVTVYVTAKSAHRKSIIPHLPTS